MTLEYILSHSVRFRAACVISFRTNPVRDWPVLSHLFKELFLTILADGKAAKAKSVKEIGRRVDRIGMKLGFLLLVFGKSGRAGEVRRKERDTRWESEGRVEKLGFDKCFGREDLRLKFPHTDSEIV